MSNQNPTGNQPIPTQKPAFFVLNPEANLSDLLDESGCLVERLIDLMTATTVLTVANGAPDAGMLLSLINHMQTSAEQVKAIIDRFAEVEASARGAGQAKPVRPLNDDERARFLGLLQSRSDEMRGTTKLKEPARVWQLEGMVELFDLLNEIGVAVPSDVASIVESEMGRVAQ
jgi:hypothetical protein